MLGERGPHMHAERVVHRTGDVVEPGSYGDMIGNLETAR